MVDHKISDLSDWLEKYCLDADGNPIRLQPWQKALLHEMQDKADEKIAKKKAVNGRPR